MNIGPLEYVVIGYEDDHFTSEILPALNTLQESDLIRVVDLVFVSTSGDGKVTVQEVSEFGEEEVRPFAGLLDDLAGWFTAEDVEHLAGAIPPGTSAVVVLLEHIWTIGLAEAVRKAGGMLFTGGMVTPEALAHVSAELAAAETVVLLVLLGAACFATFSLIIACLVKTRERFMGIGQILTMPLFFASNTIYPVAIMPPWLQAIAHANPLTYEVDGLRALMLGSSIGSSGLTLDFVVMLVVTAVLVVIGGWLYPRVAV